MTIRNVSYAPGWRARLKEIEALNEEYRKYYAIRTPVESSILSEKKLTALSNHSKIIWSGIEAELFDKARKVQLRREILQSYKRQEIDSWDSVKLATEYGVMSVILDMALVAQNQMTGDTAYPRILKLYKEVEISKNKYKLRALAELLDGVIMKNPNREEALRLDELKNKVKRAVEGLRETPDIIKARDEVQNSFEDFSQTVREYKRIGVTIDSEISFEMTLNKLNISKDDEGLGKVEIAPE